jgi:uncharacterized protein (DUF697 family)
MCAAKMPLDVREVMKAAADTESARSMPISVCVYCDAQTPPDLVDLVRRAFGTRARNATVRVVPYDAGASAALPGTDLAVLVAGLSPETGMLAGDMRTLGVPVLTVTTMPLIVKEQARAMGCALLEEDVVYPDASVDGGALPPTSDFNQEPYPLTIDRQKSLLGRMGAWVVDTFREKRLAFALAFGFVRRPLSVEFVNATAMQNAGVGLVVIIPGADMPVMTLNQAKMVLQIAAAYDQKLGKERIGELVAVVGGGFACRAVARQVVAAVPGIGWAVKAGIGYGGTAAMGYAAIAYFEKMGGEGASAAGVASAVRAEAARVQAAVRSADNPADAAKAAVSTVVADMASGAVGAVRGAAPRLRNAVFDACEDANVNPVDMGKRLLGHVTSARKPK